MHSYERKPLIYIMYPGTDVVTVENNSLYNHAENYFIGIYPDACGYAYTIRNNTGNGKPIYYYSHSSGLNVSNLDTNYLLLYDVNFSTFSNIKAPMQGSCLIGNEFNDFEVVNGLGMVIYGGIDNVIRRLYCNHCDDVSTFLGNLYVYDSVIENTDPNFEGVLPYGGGNITLINTTFDKYTFLDTVSHIIRKWWLNLSLNVPADVTIYDVFENVEYSGSISSAKIDLTQYDLWCYNYTDGCVEERNITYTPHNITATAAGYLPNSTLVTMDTNRDVFLYLEEIVVSFVLSFSKLLFGTLNVNTAANPLPNQDSGIYNVTLYSNVPFSFNVTGYDFDGPSAWPISNFKVALNETLENATLDTAKALSHGSSIQLLSGSSVDATYFFKMFLDVPDILAGDYNTTLIFTMEQV